MATEFDAEPDAQPYVHEMYLLAQAQVHATLALAAATALSVDVEGAEPQIEAWQRAGAW
jgi:hypothetical protein